MTKLYIYISFLLFRVFSTFMLLFVVNFSFGQIAVIVKKLIKSLLIIPFACFGHLLALSFLESKRKTFLLVLSLGIVGYFKGQTEISRESFTSSSANVTASHSFSNSGNSCGSSFLNCFDYKQCYTGGLADGGDDMHFYAFDQDAETGSLTPYVDIDLGTIGASNTGEIIFYGMFGANGTGFDASDGATIAINLNGAGFNTVLTVAQSSSTVLYVTDGSTSDNLSSSLVKRSYSLGSGLNGQTVVVRVSLNGIDRNDEGFGFDEFSLTHTAPACTAPTVEPADPTFSGVGTTTTTVNWASNGNGDNVLVVAKESGAVLTTPTTGVSYTADAVFGSGTQIGTGNYVVYDGAGSSVSVTGLTEATTYDYYVYAYNATGDCYYLAAYGEGSQATTCTPAALGSLGSFVFTNITSSTMDVSWTGGSGTNSLVVVKASGATHTDPTVGTAYTANTIFGSGTQIGTGNYVVYNGAGTSFTLTGLTGLTTYDFAVYTFNTPSCYNVTESTDSEITAAFNTYYVNDNSTTGDLWCSAVGSGGGTGTTASPFLTLTAAVTAAAAGDFIYVDVGTYSDENISITKDGLNIVGAGNELTIFNSDNAGGEFISILANNVVLKDMLIQEYGYNSGGGSNAQAMYIGDGSTTYTGILVQNVQIDKCGGSTGDMAVHVLANTQSTFIGGGGTCNTNTFSYSGVFHVIGTNIDLAITDYVFTGNGGDCFGGSHGGAMRINSGNATQDIEIRNSLFDKNENCVSTFNAMDIYMSSGDLKVYDCHFNNSRSAYAAGTAIGGSVEIQGGSAYFTRSKFTNHRSSGGMRGCAIGNNGGSVTLDSCYFSGNGANKADDVHNEAGTLSAFNCTWGEIGQRGGTFTIENCGDPTVFEGTIVKTNTTAPTYTASPVVPGFSGDCPTSVVLPIELNSFMSECIGSGIQINWETASEINNDYFEVEKSTDGLSFYSIGMVDGAGNSNVNNSYSLKDTEFENSSVYYRLKQTDFNGLYSYSDIITAGVCDDDLYGINDLYYNNSGSIVLKYAVSKSEKVRFYLFDVQGRLIQQEETVLNQNNNRIEIPLLDKLNDAIYLVKIMSNKGVDTKRIAILD